MGCETTLSEHGGLFSLDLSQHGGTSYSKAIDAQIRTAELQGQRLADFAMPSTAFEADVSQSTTFENNAYLTLQIALTSSL